MMTTMTEQLGAREAVIEWISHIMQRKRWTGTDLARKSGLAPSTVLRLLNDENHRFIPSLKTLQKISEGSTYPIPKKVTDALGAPNVEDREDAAPATRASVREALSGLSANPGPRRAPTVDVRHVSSLPKSLHPVSRADIAVPCPPQLEGDESAFAFYMPDSALEPWWKAGSLMYATKRRDPVAGDLVLVTDSSGRSKVRLLMDIDEKGLTMTHSHPAKEDERLGFDAIEDIAIVAVAVKI